MRLLWYKICVLLPLVLLESCNKTNIYDQKAKTLDSLSGAINSMVRELTGVDTIILQRSVTRFNYYRQFISQNVTDTVDKNEADNLQHFYLSGKNLENFQLSRKSILERAGLINVQLVKLTTDIKNKSLTEEAILKYALQEKNETAKLIELAYQQQKIFHTGLEEFKNALRGVETLIRSRNNGELPTIIKDTVAL
jgi:hypothetical protein